MRLQQLLTECGDSHPMGQPPTGSSGLLEQLHLTPSCTWAGVPVGAGAAGLGGCQGPNQGAPARAQTFILPSP